MNALNKIKDRRKADWPEGTAAGGALIRLR